jgi:hypothetical protein
LQDWSLRQTLTIAVLEVSFASDAFSNRLNNLSISVTT